MVVLAPMSLGDVCAEKRALLSLAAEIAARLPGLVRQADQDPPWSAIARQALAPASLSAKQGRRPRGLTIFNGHRGCCLLSSVLPTNYRHIPVMFTGSPA